MSSIQEQESKLWEASDVGISPVLKDDMASRITGSVLGEELWTPWLFSEFDMDSMLP